MIRIFSDSTCDLSKELLDRCRITLLPLHVVLDQEEYLDGQQITPEEIYRWSDATGHAPKTSAVSFDTVTAAFKSALDAGDEIITFAISSSMSTTGNVMRLCAQDLDAAQRITVIDSMSLSTGVGLLVMEAAAMADQGMTRSEIAGRICALRPRVRASFVVDTLTYLHRGGRCSGIAALAGSALRLHPRISVIEGAMAPGKKYRGAMSKAIPAYVRDMEKELLAAEPARVFITHSGCAQEDVDAVKAYLQSLNHFEEILVTRAGGVISCHCGPGTLGVLFIAEQDAPDPA